MLDREEPDEDSAPDLAVPVMPNPDHTTRSRTFAARPHPPPRHRPDDAALRACPDGRLDGTCARAVRGQPPEPPGVRVHRTARPEERPHRGAIVRGSRGAAAPRRRVE